jgi:hopene-associated glycosyltransferase HpnB
MIWIAAFSLAVWAVLFAFHGGFWRVSAALLPPACPLPGDVVAVIPARNEAGLVGLAVKSLVRQTAAVYVVDDHSADSTAAEALAAGATVVAAHPLPPGWAGKLWAVSEGLEPALAAGPRYVLLTDADIVHAPDAVAGLVAHAEATGCDLVSLMVKLHCDTVVEKALIPAFVFFFLKLYPPAWTAQLRSRTAGAAGGCMLVRATALQRIGGIAAIRGALIDDCALAGAIKRSGGRIWMGLAGESRSIRGYGGIGGIWDMIARTAFTQLHHSAALLAGTVCGMALIYAAPPLLAIACTGAVRWLGAAAWTLMLLAYLPAVDYYDLSPLWAMSLPVVAAVYSAATVDSALRYWRGAGGTWKGRVQDGR